MSHIILYHDIDGSELSIDEPLTESVEFSQLVSDLNIPSFVNFESKAIKMAIGAIWAAKHSQELFGAEGKKLKLRVSPTLLAFGSLAIKLLCPSSNISNSPFNRPIGDLDFVAKSKEATGIVNLLMQMNTKLGTQYYFFLTPQDKSFNALRGGRRYRVRMLVGVDVETPLIKDVDIFCDVVELRHSLAFDSEFDVAQHNTWTIGSEKLLLSKIQGIMEISENERMYLNDNGQNFRILDYPYYRKGRLIIGMEWKDMLDTCSLLHDCIGGVKNVLNINPDEVGLLLRRDKRFALTARLNLSNIIRNEDFLKSRGLPSTAVSQIIKNAQKLLDAIPVVDKKWSRPWWNDDVETPIVA